ncbi:hypothetical protein JMJ35_004077 [Cladonia borealis]|uniref:Uncharacterized protein n=1 Tax=Cladonia borealis TaxID=184061 RepID=A0AA39R305_9LECA|nr:hypothetical protein JMJ35_004077 [Cladonia borealis]
MDGSPLILAQNHARKASKANTPKTAVEEHDLAAGQFATAAKGTENSEAQAVLNLLEQHHQKLAQLLKFRNSNPITQLPEATPEVTSAPQQPPSPTPQAHAGSPYRPASQTLPAAHRPQRDVSSSIASNLASARGIPSNKQRRSGQVSSPVLAQHQAEGKVFSPSRRSKLGDVPSTATPTSPSEKEKSAHQSETSSQPTSPSTKAPPSEPDIPESLSPKSDEPFQRFYSTFETLFSKLSAPLAFAGLPLSQDDPPQSQPHPPTEKPTSPTRPPIKSSDRATSEPDYSRLFSRAALRAVREEPGGPTLGATESFYVVPTTGGTMPYASILARPGHHYPNIERENTRTSNEDLEEFVDARETPGPPSPQLLRGSKRAGAGAGLNTTKTMEELHYENENLRDVLDKTTRRLWEFEMGAQASSTALHQSIRASLKQSPATSVVGAGVNNGDIEMRLAKLEEEVREGKKEVERLGKENEKLRGVVGRYRERWEKLKEGARSRREGGGGVGREEEG